MVAHKALLAALAAATFHVQTHAAPYLQGTTVADQEKAWPIPATETGHSAAVEVSQDIIWPEYRVQIQPPQDPKTVSTWQSNIRTTATQTSRNRRPCELEIHTVINRLPHLLKTNLKYQSGSAGRAWGFITGMHKGDYYEVIANQECKIVRISSAYSDGTLIFTSKVGQSSPSWFNPGQMCSSFVKWCTKRDGQRQN